jgi:sulfopyruvate decarboxylase subunit beta
MKRIDALKAIVEGCVNLPLICNLGYPSRELYSLGDRDLNFYMLGSMGLASSIGLGLSIALRSKVVVADGDGSLLMNLGSLATIGYTSPKNMVLLVLDNASYGTTGGQETATSGATDLAEVAKAAGIRSTRRIRNLGSLRRVLKEALESEGPHVIVVKVEKGNADVPEIELSPQQIKKRFVHAVSRFKS